MCILNKARQFQSKILIKVSRYAGISLLAKFLVTASYDNFLLGFGGWAYLALFRIRNNRNGLLGTASLIRSLVG
jgi:hypothetical protein